jgi:hypothetical protein
MGELGTVQRRQPVWSLSVGAPATRGPEPQRSTRVTAASSSAASPAPT